MNSGETTLPSMDNDGSGIQVHATAAPGEYVRLVVSDTGSGMTDEVKARVFEPFFTTKNTGQGTGLGLAVSQGIVKDHDGWMEVGDRPQGGAVFRVFLPVHADPSLVTELAPGASIGKDQ